MIALFLSPNKLDQIPLHSSQLSKYKVKLEQRPDIYLLIISASLSINIASVSAHLTDRSPSPSVDLCVCLSVQSVCPESVLWQNG